MKAKKHPGNRRPHPPTAQARRTLHALTQPHPRDPWAITAPVDTTYRYRSSEQDYIRPSDHDRYAGLVAYRPEED